MTNKVVISPLFSETVHTLWFSCNKLHFSVLFLSTSREREGTIVYCESDNMNLFVGTP